MPILIACTLVLSLCGVLISNVTSLDAPSKQVSFFSFFPPLPPPSSPSSSLSLSLFFFPPPPCPRPSFVTSFPLFSSPLSLSLLSPPPSPLLLVRVPLSPSSPPPCPCASFPLLSCIPLLFSSLSVSIFGPPRPCTCPSFPLLLQWCSALHYTIYHIVKFLSRRNIFFRPPPCVPLVVYLAKRFINLFMHYAFFIVVHSFVFFRSLSFFYRSLYS